MADKLIFLSHICEEHEVALDIKLALEGEFGGIVDVFLSSDAASPTGTNFLERMSNALATCVGAIYLISPVSIKRKRAAFEMGAVWIRSFSEDRRGQPEIFTLPFCHSGCQPSNLPAPLNSLNAIIANQANQLSMAFRSIQKSVGGRGPLKTNFDALAQKVMYFEHNFSVFVNVQKMCALLGLGIDALKDEVGNEPIVTTAGVVEHHMLRDFRSLISALPQVDARPWGAIRASMSTDNGRATRSGTEYLIRFERRLLDYPKINDVRANPFGP